MLRALSTALGVCLTIALVACSGAPAGSTSRAPTASGTQPAGQITIGSAEEPANLNPLSALPHHFPQHAPYPMIFDSLIQIAPDGTLRPRLASRWAAAPDNLSFTFELDPAARFHDGQPVTAADVAFTFQAIMDPTINTAKDGSESIAAVEAVDPQTVRFALKKVDPLFLPRAGSRGIVPKHRLEGRDLLKDEFNRQPVGSGPYRFVSWQAGGAIVLEANAGYHLGAPKNRRLVFKIVPDRNVLLGQLRSGELDYGLVEPKDAKLAAAIAHVQLVEAPSPRFYGLGLNLRLPLFQDRAVREALMLAAPRSEIVETVMEGKGTLIDSNASPASWAYNPAVRKYPYDPARARAVLEAAGWAVGSDGVRTRNGQRLAFTASYVVTEKQTEQALIVMQQRYREVGIGLSLKGLEATDLLGRAWPKGDFEASFQLWNPVYDPDQSSTFRTGGGYNGTGYANPKVDALFDQALSTFDVATRQQAYGEIQAILAEDLPMIWLYSNRELHAVSSRVSGFEAHPINPFWNVQDWAVR